MTQPRQKYEQLIQDLRKEYRPQRDWGEGRGVFLVIGHFLVGVAAGTWLFAVLLAYRKGLVVALGLAGLGGIAHLAFLGQPQRFWRMATRIRTSWISRGFAGLSVFLAGAFAYVVSLYAGGLDGAPWTPEKPLAATGYVLAMIGMAVMMGYMGFCYTSSKAIPFWHSSLHPAVYVAYALRGGAAALIVTVWLAGDAEQKAFALFPYWIFATVAVVAFFLLELHGALTGGNGAARRSVGDLLAGRVALYFYGGTLALGLLVPAYLALNGAAGPIEMGTLAALGVSSVIGDFFMKYSTVRAGVHLPVWTRLSPGRR